MGEGSGRLAGRAAIVTGSARGIGRAIALRFAAEGARVVCADVNVAGAGETAAMIGAAAVAVRCDVSAAADAKAAVDLAVARFGGLHVLVNNAMMPATYGTVVEVPEAEWTRSLAVNLTGPFLMSKYAVPVMASGGGGSIIHVASQLGQVAKRGRSWYGAAKAGLIHLAKTMALEHAEQGIRVNSISPGPIGTERIYALYGDRSQAEADSGGLTLMKRLGRPEEIAAAALFLACDESSFMTGADLLVDGGYTAV